MRLLLLFIVLGAMGSAAQADDRLLEPAELRGGAAFEKQLQQDPASAAVHFNYAGFLADHGQTRAAIAHLRIAQLLEPGNGAIANSLGGAYLRMGRAAESAGQFQRAVNCAGEVAAYHYNLGNVEFVLRHDLTAAWKIDDADLLRKALLEFRAASRLSPNDMEYARGYAETFYALPDPDWAEAAAAWKHVLALAPDSDFTFLQLARVSLKLGDKAQARSFLDQIKDSRHDGLKQKLRLQADKL
ncbi:MAG: hypothetical protein ACR2MW_10460 [Chthoniobacterales bacterium]